MINTSRFCPYERILALVTVKLSRVEAFLGGWFVLTFDDGYVTPKFPIEATPVIDRALGRGDADRKTTLGRDKFSVVCNITDKDGRGYSRKIEVENSLLTDEMPASYLEEGTARLTNGVTADGTTIMYPEAYFTTEGGAFAATKRENVIPGILRPLYQYILVSIEGDLWKVSGPSNILFKYTKVGDAKVRHWSDKAKAAVTVDYALLEEGSFVNNEVPVIANNAVTEKKDFGRWKVILSDDVFETEFSFTSRPRGLNSSFLRGEGVLDIMRALVHIEERAAIGAEAFQQAVAALNCRTRDDQLIIPCEVFNGYTRVAPKVHDAIDTYASKSTAVTKALAGYIVIADCLAFKDPSSVNQYFALVGSAIQSSTFCLSFVHLVADAQLTGSWTDIFQAFTLAIGNGLFVADAQAEGMPAGVLTLRGATAKITGAVLNYKFDTLRASASVSLTRKDYQAKDLHDLKDGLYILGFSYADDKAAGRPDSYILVEAMSGKLKVVHDPSADAPYPRGYDVTSRLDDSVESVLIGFISDGRIGGVAVTNGDTEALRG